MRLCVLGLAATVLSGGCAKPYLETPAVPERLTGAVQGVSLERQPDGTCTVTLAIKGAGTGRVEVPRQWCHDAKVSQTAAALVPKAEPAK